MGNWKTTTEIRLEGKISNIKSKWSNNKAEKIRGKTVLTQVVAEVKWPEVKFCLSGDVGEGNVDAVLCKNFDVMYQKSDLPRDRNNTKMSIRKATVSLLIYKRTRKHIYQPDCSFFSGIIRPKLGRE